MEDRLIVAVGGHSKHKVGATERALERLVGYVPINEAFEVRPTDSGGGGLREQPIGLEEGYRGAVFRAESALLHDATASTGVGIENTFVYVGPGTWVDIAVVAVVTRDNPTPTITTSVGIPGPAGAVGASIARGQDITAGEVISRGETCDKTDWHRHFMSHQLGREDLLADALFAAFLLRFNGR